MAKKNETRQEAIETLIKHAAKGIHHGEIDVSDAHEKLEYEKNVLSAERNRHVHLKEIQKEDQNEDP